MGDLDKDRRRGVSKKIVVILMITILLGLAIGAKFISTVQSQDEISSSDLDRLEEKLDVILDILKRKDDTDKEILNKLEQVLDNQAEMKEHLSVIKVRATRR